MTALTDLYACHEACLASVNQGSGSAAQRVAVRRVEVRGKPGTAFIPTHSIAQQSTKRCVRHPWQTHVTQWSTTSNKTHSTTGAQQGAHAPEEVELRRKLAGVPSRTARDVKFVQDSLKQQLLRLNLGDLHVAVCVAVCQHLLLDGCWQVSEQRLVGW